MQGKNLFLNNVVSRTNEWQCRYPALSNAWQDAQSLSAGKQVVAAIADADGVRCVFFSSLGSVLDFNASWADLDNAKTWWHFTLRWNFWFFSDAASLLAMRAAGYDPEYRKLLAPSGLPADRHSADGLTAFLDRAEARFRHECAFPQQPQVLCNQPGPAATPA